MWATGEQRQAPYRRSPGHTPGGPAGPWGFPQQQRPFPRPHAGGEPWEAAGTDALCSTAVLTRPLLGWESPRGGGLSLEAQGSERVSPRRTGTTSRGSLGPAVCGAWILHSRASNISPRNTGTILDPHPGGARPAGDLGLRSVLETSSIWSLTRGGPCIPATVSVCACHPMQLFVTPHPSQKGPGQGTDP